jgi:hypothetical protein
MTCEHLMPVEAAIQAAGMRETFRGAAWSDNCREWVCFDCYLPTQLLLDVFQLPPCIKIRSHLGTHDGQEHGLVCCEHHDALMGHHPKSTIAAPTFKP